MVYALVYNWLYDIVFPVPSLKAQPKPEGAALG